ncbi:hypothetical protein GCM10007890_02230 [Methylobacterium tardum]|uniref:Uncharacterized protein n=1 Tax=Methylobacterium tardum TaxID=374432 RepID=A0AA37T7T5_9HYPH|nr:hypothetical protein GCM10007890_02230 [Methylobacterium tardum]
MRTSEAVARIFVTAMTDGSQFVATSVTECRMPESLASESTPWPTQISARKLKAAAREALIERERRMDRMGAGETEQCAARAVTRYMHPALVMVRR